MGNYLEQPITTKNTIIGNSKNLNYVISDMQGKQRPFFSLLGWRTNMEDAHIVNLNLPKDCAIFGIFDGHGGNQTCSVSD